MFVILKGEMIRDDLQSRFCFITVAHLSLCTHQAGFFFFCRCVALLVLLDITATAERVSTKPVYLVLVIKKVTTDNVNSTKVIISQASIGNNFTDFCDSHG